MRSMLATALLSITLPAWATADSVTVPWSEFKELYTEQIRQSLTSKDPDTEPPVYSLEVAEYDLQVREIGVEGQVRLSGRVLRGHPPAVPAFGKEVAVTEIVDAQGASLVGSEQGYLLYLETEDRFSATLRIALPYREERDARRVSLGIPSAVTSSLKLEVPPEWRLVEPPGVRHADGRYFLPPTQTLSFGLVQADIDTEDVVPLVDVFSEVSVKGDRYVVTTWFAPLEVPTDGVSIRVPPQARVIDTTLTPRWMQASSPGALAVSLPSSWEGAFHIRLELTAADGTTRLRLPSIDGNEGRQGEFQILQPRDGHVTLVGEGYRRGLSGAHLPEAIQQQTSTTGRILQAPLGGEIRLALTRLDAVAAPETVLDSVHFYTSFTEDGRALCLLRLELPTGGDDKLTLKAVAGSEIWSLTVNGKPQRLFRHTDAEWIIPLGQGKGSVVELAYLIKGGRLGLDGRLDLAIPATGIAARQLHAAIGLPPRVELIALEGELMPTDEDDWPRLRDFRGTAYHFVHPYYRGQGLTAAAYYKEPVLGQGR